MRFGIVGTYGTVAQVVQMAEEAEAHGWDGFFTWDGISLGPMDTWDPWVVLGAVAARTDRIRLGAMVFSLARRRPWKAAREVLTVDRLSGGRLVLPVGLGAVDDGGYSRVSGEARSARERAERLDEVLAVLDLAASGRPFSHHGTHHTAEDLQIAPPTVQRPRVPVWPVAGWRSQRSMARAARWDGAVLQRVGGADPLRPDEVAQAAAWLHERRAAAAPAERREGDFDVVVEGALPAGDAAARKRVRALADAGATWWIESRWDPERDTPADLLDRIRRGPPQA